MKKTIFFFLAGVYLLSCNNKSNTPDVSGNDVQVNIERFDRDFFAIDSNNMSAGLRQLQSSYPGFYRDYMQSVLGVSGSDTDRPTQQMVRMMLGNYTSLYQAVSPKFSNTAALEKDIRKGFQFVKYYFPDYRIPKLITFVGTLDAPGMALTQQYIAVGLHQYAGKDFPGYQLEEVQQLYPTYISRRFSPEFMPANCLKAVITDLFPDNSNGKPLVEQMIEKGKQWWLLDKFLPGVHDSLKTGYTKKQLDWCEDNEGLIWSHLVKNEDLQSISPATIQIYIGESPFTQSFSQEYSPGNLGPWIGWQIIKKYENKNPGMQPADIMRTDAKKILEEAKYKPK
jgi:hypothetical protein